MPGTTSNYNLPYPQGTDDAIIAQDIQSLAEGVDTSLVLFDATVSADISDVQNQLDIVKTNTRHISGSTFIYDGDLLICEAASLITIQLPDIGNEDFIARIVNVGTGAVQVSGLGTINGNTQITKTGAGMIVTYTNSQWWCLPLSSSSGGGTGGGVWTDTPWTRPSTWLEQPEIISTTDAKYVLIHIPYNTTVTLGFSIRGWAAGSFYIDWGDGQAQTGSMTTSYTYVYHTYVWSNLDSYKELGDGTRQVWAYVEPLTVGVDYIRNAFTLDEYGSYPAYRGDFYKEEIYALKHATTNTSIQYVDSVAFSTENLVVYSDGQGGGYGISGVADYDGQSLKRATMYLNGDTYFDASYSFEACPIDSIYFYGTAVEVELYQMANLCASIQNFYIDGSLIPKVNDWGYMFYNCGTQENLLPDIDGADVSGSSWGTYYQDAFQSVDGIIVRNTGNAMDGWFYGNYGLVTATNLDFSGNSSVNSIFNDCFGLKEVDGFYAPSNVYGSLSHRYMFESAYNLKYVRNLDVSGIINAQYMFAYCYNLEEIDSIGDTSNMTIAQRMFAYCYQLKTLPPELDTSSVTDASYMFAYCYQLKSLPALDMSNATSGTYFAQGCSNLESSDVYGMTVSHSYLGCNLNAAALNNIYTNLGVASSGKPVASAYYSGSYIYYTFSTPHGLASNSYTTFTGFSPSGYNRTNIYTYIQNTTTLYVYVGATNPGVATVLGTWWNSPTAGTTIDVQQNPGISGDDPTIAQAKGWTVTG